MCVRVLLSIWALLALSLPTLRVQAAESWQNYYRQAKTSVEAQEWQQAIRLLHKALQENPQPRKAKDLDWTAWDGYYPYLELGKVYLKIDDPFSASYYCSRSKSEGASPVEEVSDCLDAATVMLKYYRPSMTTRALSFEFPLFPWPPPEASATVVIPSSYLIDSSSPPHLKDVASRLKNALFSAGYVEFSYYQVPEGFAMVTRLEQFSESGASKAPPDRWVLDMPPAKIFSLADYLKALFQAEKGHYRLMSFLVTSVPFSQSPQKINREDAMAWLARGANVLPAEIGEQPYSGNHYCTALIYEFEQITRDHDATFQHPGMLTGDVHLEKSLLLGALEQFPSGTAP